MLSSVFFIPNRGILWGGVESGSLLGIQLLGWAAVSVWTLIVTWIYFFSLKKCHMLKLKRAEEVIGHDTINMAKSKGIDISQLL
jgi:ammonia channel protein AmtB